MQCTAIWISGLSCCSSQTHLFQLVQRVLLLVCSAEHHTSNKGAQLCRQALQSKTGRSSHVYAARIANLFLQDSTCTVVQITCMLRTRRPLIQEPTRQNAMMVSWYSSSVACSASCRTARGSTVRANATATASDRPRDITTLQDASERMAQCMQ